MRIATLLCVVSLAASTPLCAQETPETIERLGKGSGSLRDVIQGTHSHPTLPPTSMDLLDPEGALEQRTAFYKAALEQQNPDGSLPDWARTQIDAQNARINALLAEDAALRATAWGKVRLGTTAALPTAGVIAGSDLESPIMDVAALAFLTGVVGGALLDHYVFSQSASHPSSTRRERAVTEEEAERRGLGLVRVQLQRGLGNGESLTFKTIALTAPDERGVRVAAVEAALAALRADPAIPRKRQTRLQADAALAAALKWTRSRPPAGVVASPPRSSWTFPFDPSDSRSYRFDIEVKVGHNLRE